MNNIDTDIWPAGNSTYPKVVVQWFNQALYYYQSLSLVDSEVFRNRHPRVAVKRYLQADLNKRPKMKL